VGDGDIEVVTIQGGMIISVFGQFLMTVIRWLTLIQCGLVTQWLGRLGR